MEKERNEERLKVASMEEELATLRSALQEAKNSIRTLADRATSAERRADRQQQRANRLLHAATTVIHESTKQHRTWAEAQSAAVRQANNSPLEDSPQSSNKSDRESSSESEITINRRSKRRRLRTGGPAQG